MIQFLTFNVNLVHDRLAIVIIVCIQIAGIGHVNSFGLIYNDFINDTNSTAKSLTTAHGVFAVMLAIGGWLLLCDVFETK